MCDLLARRLAAFALLSLIENQLLDTKDVKHFFKSFKLQKNLNFAQKHAFSFHEVKPICRAFFNKSPKPTVMTSCETYQSQMKWPETYATHPKVLF